MHAACWGERALTWAVCSRWIGKLPEWGLRTRPRIPADPSVAWHHLHCSPSQQWTKPERITGGTGARRKHWNTHTSHTKLYLSLWTMEWVSKTHTMDYSGYSELLSSLGRNQRLSMVLMLTLATKHRENYVFICEYTCTYRDLYWPGY